MPSATSAKSPSLCASCLHARRVESAKGSGFLLCQLSQSNPRFPKYPRLPVLECSGYKKAVSLSPKSEAEEGFIAQKA